MFLAEVSLNLAGRTHRCLPWVSTRLTQCPTLPQQVPALVEFDLHSAQAFVLLGLADVAALQLRPQGFLLGDQVADVYQGVAVRWFAPITHRSSVPETRDAT